MALTCATDSLLTDAHFSYSASPDNPLHFIFQAEQYDPATQTCQWSFGDGAIAGLTGGVVQYTFQQAGPHNVCLLIKSNLGVVAQACKEVLVSGALSSSCGFDTYITAVGTQLYAKLLPLNSNAGVLYSVNWTLGNNGPVVGDSSVISLPLPDYGAYVVCANFTVKGGGIEPFCTATICKPLNITEPGCVDPQLMTTVPVCPVDEVPVCGCDGLSYANECDAQAAGITTWWAGSCSSIYGSCTADMALSLMAGDPELGYSVKFKNLSVGTFSNSHLDFGDGSPIWETTQWDSTTHHYQGGLYRATLSAWKQNACASTVTKLLVTDAFNLTVGNLPPKPDYVLPGDADGDTKANVYDLLDIGVGYLATGSPRPNASTAFVPQYAANWPDQLPQTLNFKHFDCDGDGMVLDLDADVILAHYSAIDSTEVPAITTAPKVWVKFMQDTITVDPNNPVPLEITADILVGSEEAPALGLHGLAFALMYPEYVEHDPAVDYKNDFFGISNHILWLPKDNYSRRQLDLGFTQKYENASGFGRIATVTFRSDIVIIVDIIARETGDIKPFTVPVRGLKAIGADGQVLQFGAGLSDTVWIKLLPTSGTQEKNLDQRVNIYPNPASSDVRILTGDLELEHLEVVNSLGQVFYSALPEAGRVQ
ncbi:MAG: PKD domain-containing protein, partial [Saprospiraceae bacterium]